MYIVASFERLITAVQ